MQFFLILASLVSVAAFAPASRMATSAALRMSFEDALGAQAPLGFWDPLGKITIQLEQFASSSAISSPYFPTSSASSSSCYHLMSCILAF